MKTKIIPVEAADQIRTVADLARSIWTEHFTPIIGREQVDYMLDKIQSVPAITTQIAHEYDYVLIEHDGTTMGYMAIIPESDPGTLMISKLYVQKSARGLGLGCQLLAHAEEQCRQHHLETLWLTCNKNNATSLAWYQKRGFTKTRAWVQEIGNGFVMDDYRMEKHLAAHKKG